MNEILTSASSAPFFGPERRHRLAIYTLSACFIALIAWVVWYGRDYYTLSRPERALHPLYRELRPSGPIGIRLGILGAGCFAALFLYPIRKRWKWLSRKGKTKNWLDVHIVFGLAAPAVITLHSGFRLRGIAGTAYWIMIAVMLSGIVGRYLYAQIPRTIGSAEVTLQQLERSVLDLAFRLESLHLVEADQLKRLLAVPDKAKVDGLPLLAALWLMFVNDLRRPFRIARVRRRMLSLPARLLTLGGLLPSRDRRLEDAVELARRQSWLSAKIVFLSKARAVFHLWHVVHRPFSYSFVVLASIHIVVVALMGYF